MNPRRSLQEILDAHQDHLMERYSAIERVAGPRRIFWDDDLNAWVVTGYQECIALLNSPSVVRAQPNLPEEEECADLMAFVGSVLRSQTMFSAGPAVAARRRFWTKVLNGAGPQANSSDPVRIAAEMLEGAIPDNTFDLYSSLLQPYVSQVVCSRLGIEDEERKRLYPLVMQYANFLDAKLRQRHELHLACYAIAYLYANLAGKSDLFADATSTRHERICDYVLNLAAGHESTAYLLGTVLIQAGGEAGHLAAAGTDRAGLARILWEAARFDSPVQLIGRCVQLDLSLNGHLFEAGDRLFLHVGAANRDDRVFQDPHSFDPGRSGPPALSFGLGSTKCIGQNLAMVEAHAFLSALASSGGRLEIDLAKVTRSSGIAGQSFRALPAVWRPAVPNDTLPRAAPLGIAG